MSFDAKSLYTYTNIKLTVQYIITEIYKNPDAHFNERTKETNGQTIQIPKPPRKTFKKFIMDVFNKFNSFSSVNGFYKQVDGLSMGSRLSPLISNLYCNMMEQKVITKFIKNNTIISQKRYFDDVFLCCIKGSFEKILREMNNFDKCNLEFTVKE